MPFISRKKLKEINKSLSDFKREVDYLGEIYQNEVDHNKSNEEHIKMLERQAVEREIYAAWTIINIAKARKLRIVKNGETKTMVLIPFKDKYYYTTLSGERYDELNSEITEISADSDLKMGGDINELIKNHLIEMHEEIMLYSFPNISEESLKKSIERIKIEIREV